jgi:hypothetical protein
LRAVDDAHPNVAEVQTFVWPTAVTAPHVSTVSAPAHAFAWVGTADVAAVAIDGVAGSGEAPGVGVAVIPAKGIVISKHPFCNFYD